MGLRRSNIDDIAICQEMDVEVQADFDHSCMTSTCYKDLLPDDRALHDRL
jgi:hypothetical protein